MTTTLLTLDQRLLEATGDWLQVDTTTAITANAYITQTIETLELFDVFWGLLKSGVFALLIAWIGCLKGFKVKSGAASVGQATTSAVVSSIFFIILSDSIFAIILCYWG